MAETGTPRRDTAPRERTPPAARSGDADALVITGATATGKTALSLDVAERIGGGIISMDSRQVYRGMDIGTAKATPEERARVPHYGLDLIDPDERYSAGRFARDARAWIAALRARGRVPVLVGGTGFFLRALTHPLFVEPEMETERRERLKRYLGAQPLGKLRRWLGVLDPLTARSLEARGGRQRVARAIEVALLSGRPLSWWHRHAVGRVPPLRAVIFVLDLPRDTLYRRIDQRVLDMVAAGLVDEVRALLDAGYGPGDPGMNATGYAEFVRYIRGEWSLEQAIDATQRATRRYARRQLTWLRHQLPAGAHWLDASRPRTELAHQVIEVWNEEDS